MLVGSRAVVPGRTTPDVVRDNTGGSPISNEDNKAVTKRLYTTIAEVFRTGTLELLDPLLAPDMIDHAAPNGPVIGREPGKQLIATYARLSGYHPDG